VAQQYQDSARVGFRFEKAWGEAVPHGVRMDLPVLKACAFSGGLACGPEGLGGDGVTCRVPAVAGKEPLLRLAAQAAPLEHFRNTCRLFESSAR